MHILIDCSNNYCYALSLSRCGFSNQFPAPNQERTRATATVRLHNVLLYIPYQYKLLYIYTSMCMCVYKSSDMICSRPSMNPKVEIVEREREIINIGKYL